MDFWLIFYTAHIQISDLTADPLWASEFMQRMFVLQKAPEAPSAYHMSESAYCHRRQQQPGEIQHQQK